MDEFRAICDVRVLGVAACVKHEIAAVIELTQLAAASSAPFGIRADALAIGAVAVGR